MQQKKLHLQFRENEIRLALSWWSTTPTPSTFLGETLACYERPCHDLLAPALVHEGTGTDLGPRSPQIRISHCRECLCVCGCLPPLWGIVFGRGDFKHITLLIGVEATFMFCNRFIRAQKYQGLREHQAVEGYPSSHIHNIFGCWTVKSVKSNWEMQISLWHLEQWTVFFFLLDGSEICTHSFFFWGIKSCSLTLKPSIH